jgi:hypothetical protein
MEKLLYSAKKQRKNNASNLTGQHKKISSLAMGATKIFFAKAQQKLF